MDKTIFGAIIGASSAIVINGLIFIISRYHELKRDKIQVISEIISHLYNQLRYSKRFVGHQVWLNFNHRVFPLTKKAELRSIISRKIDFLVKLTEELESKFIESDSRLATLTARYKSLYPRDKHFCQSIKTFNEYVLDENIKINDFKDWEDQVFDDPEIDDKIKNEELETYKMLKENFSPLVNEIIEYLENKI